MRKQPGAVLHPGQGCGSRDTNRVATGVFQERWNWEELGYQTPGRLPPGGDRDGESLHSDNVLK